MSGEKVARRVSAKKSNGIAKATRARKPKAEGERSVMSGLRAKPKGKSLFVNTDGALAVMRKSLKSFLKDGGPSEAERFDAERLVARLESRIS